MNEVICTGVTQELVTELRKNREAALIHKVMALMTENGNIVSIGFNETLKCLKLRMLKYIVLSALKYRFVVQLCDNNINNNVRIEFIQNEMELNILKKKHKTTRMNLKTISFISYFHSLCVQYNAELKLVNASCQVTQKFDNDFGCIGVLHYAMDMCTCDPSLRLHSDLLN